MTLRRAVCVPITVACLLFAALSAPADAQTANCGERGNVGRLLADRWGESVRMRGLATNGALVEVWANPTTGTWTFTVTVPGGPTCLVASGTDFELTPDPAVPEGEES